MWPRPRSATDLTDSGQSIVEPLSESLRDFRLPYAAMYISEELRACGRPRGRVFKSWRRTGHILQVSRGP